jgi:hypothetical protein
MFSVAMIVTFSLARRVRMIRYLAFLCAITAEPGWSVIATANNPDATTSREFWWFS